MESKACLRCKITKTLAEFSSDKRRHDGLAVYCRPCVAVKNLAQRTREQATVEGREIRRMRLRAAYVRKYGMTVADFKDLEDRQGGTCAICERPETAAQTGPSKDRPRLLAIDHDHVTNKIRGLLCHRCNVVLGLVGDDPDRLERAARYLRR